MVFDIFEFESKSNKWKIRILFSISKSKRNLNILMRFFILNWACLWKNTRNGWKCNGFVRNRWSVMKASGQWPFSFNIQFSLKNTPWVINNFNEIISTGNLTTFSKNIWRRKSAIFIKKTGVNKLRKETFSINWRQLITALN